MQDRELYQRIAEGIAPWSVGEIQVESAAQRLEVRVECHDAVPKQCPHCDRILLICDHGKEQTWRQPDDGPWQIFLKGRLPLVECPEHGFVRLSPPWANWYVRGTDNSVLGPWSLQQMQLLLDAKHISPSTLLKRSNSDKWVITGTVNALFVRRDETLQSWLSPDELAAVDWAFADGPVVFMSIEPTASESIATEDNASGVKAPEGGPSHHSDGNGVGDSHKGRRRNRQSNQPPVTDVTPAVQDVDSGELKLAPDSDGLDDLNRGAVRESLSSPKPSRPSAPREPVKRPATREEPSPPEWNMVALEQAVKMESKAKGVRKKPVDNAAAPRVKAATPREALVRRRGFQHGYQLLTMVYLINACLVCCLVPLVCMIFFSRLLLLSTSVFAPFEGGNALQEGQLVACGLSALSLLVLIGFPLWHLISNGGMLLHYGPSALLGMTIGFGLPPDYLDEVCAALQCCEFVLGIVTVGLMAYALSAVPAKSRMSLPLIAAGLLTVLSVLALCFVRSGSMLSVQADAIPPQFRGVLPDAPLYVVGLCGTLVLIPGAILFELYRHTDVSTRQFIIHTGVMFGVYLVVGIAALGTFVHGAGTGFFDVPLALLPLGCVNALAAAIPSVLLLVDPQFSVSQD